MLATRSPPGETRDQRRLRRTIDKAWPAAAASAALLQLLVCALGFNFIRSMTIVKGKHHALYYVDERTSDMHIPRLIRTQFYALMTVTGLLVGALSINAPAVHASANDWQKGVSIQSRWTDDFASPSFRASVDNAAATGINYVSLVVSIHQSSIYSTDLQAGTDTPSDAALASAIDYVHSKGLKVSISLHVNPYDGQWRAFINPGDRDGWFRNYGTFVQKYATLAQQHGVEQIVLGTELSSMTMPSINSTNTSNWQSLIASARSVYAGSLTYSAQHEGYMADDRSLGFWPQLDTIGLSAYYSLGSGSPSVEDIKASWDRWNNSSIRSLADTYRKPIIFTEVGFQSKTNALQDPGASYAWGGSVDLDLQAKAYQAMFEYWNAYPYFGGVLLWDWSSDPNSGGSGNNDYTPQNKPAQTVMKQWFGSAQQPVTPPPANPATVSVHVASAKPYLMLGTPATITVDVASSTAYAGALVDLELYGPSGERVAQVFVENQQLTAAAKPYTLTYTPTTAGDYTMKVGVFTPNWAQNMLWNDSLWVASAQAVAAPSPTPASPAMLSVWWPSDGSVVQGVQPFKAVLMGTDVHSYDMYWQVDGGALNAMMDVNGEAMVHKEALVDLSPWSWSADGRYTVTFVARSKTGAPIAEKAVAMRVNH
jgi:hypothetical protein